MEDEQDDWETRTLEEGGKKGEKERRGRTLATSIHHISKEQELRRDFEQEDAQEYQEFMESLS